jgi:GT2 family glycosyltransferase
MAPISISTVIVAHNSVADLRVALPRLFEQLEPQDEVIVVDSGSTDGLGVELPLMAPRARLISPGANVGFAAGANRGAATATGDLLVLLNPDAVVQPGWSDAIRSPWGREWAAWMGLVLLRDGLAINTSGGILHFTGFGWAGQVDQPVGAAPRAPTEVGFLSGACLAMPLARWRRTGGFAESFFMYCEDVDLSLRLRLCGAKMAVIPQATVAHDYEFGKGQLKWRLLERNRWATVIRTYPTPLLAAVMPALLAAEAAVWTVAARDGWARMKAWATFDVVRALPHLIAQRRAIQASARISPSQFAAAMTASLDSPYLGSVAFRPLLRRALGAYWEAVLWLLERVRVPSGDGGGSSGP